MPPIPRKIFVEETEKELFNMSREEATLMLNEKQRKFCEYYAVSFNNKMAALKAGYSPRTAPYVGWRLRQNPDCNRYIAWLKLRVSKECHIEASDIIDQYIRIAFADMTDFVYIKNNMLVLKDSTKIDGQIITKIRQSKEGIEITLADKMKALEKLEKYFDVMPKDWQEKIEERKLEIAEKQLELQKIRLGYVEETEEDDGFLEALKDVAEEVWEVEE
jgi:phage terminase small subunit